MSAAAYFFLALVSKLQGWIFTALPPRWASTASRCGGRSCRWCWPGCWSPLAIRYLPGTGGHSPGRRVQGGEGAPGPAELPGVVLAALATLSLGVVLGPEAPLIALGGGLGVCAVRLVKRDAPDRTRTVVAAAGSFAAISTLLGSPLLGAFLLMEASGLGGATLELVLLPGLLAAGIGSLVFIGLDALDRPGHVLAARSRTCRTSGRPTGRRVRLGRGDRARGGAARHRHPLARAVPPGPTRAAHAAGHARWSAWPWPGWPSRYAAGTGKGVGRGAVLRADRAAAR